MGRGPDLGFFGSGSRCWQGLEQTPDGVGVGYAHYVAGKRPFNQVLVVGLRFIWEKEKVKPEVSSTRKTAPLGFPSGTS
jgi:hypothetical protein